MPRLSALLALVLLTACAGRSAPPPTTPRDDGARYPELERAGSLVQSGRCAEALAQVIEPVLARMEQDFPEPRQSDRATEAAARSLGDALGASGLAIMAQMTPTLYPDTLYLAAFCHIELGHPDEAERYLARAIAVMEDVVYLCELGHLQQVRQDHPTALRTFERALASANALASRDGMDIRPLGNDVSFWKRRALRGIGFSLIELRRFDDAVAIYREVLAIDPNDVQAQQELAYIEEQRRATR